MSLTYSPPTTERRKPPKQRVHFQFMTTIFLWANKDWYTICWTDCPAMDNKKTISAPGDIEPDNSSAMVVIPKTTSDTDVIQDNSSRMNTIAMTALEIEKSMYSLGHYGDEMTGLPCLESVKDEVQKFVEPHLASLVVNGSSQVQIDLNFHFHAKEEKGNLKNNHTLGVNNENMSVDPVSNKSDTEYEYVLYTPSSMRKDADTPAALHESNSLPEFQNLALDPSAPQTFHSEFYLPEDNDNLNTFFHTPSYSLPLDINSASVTPQCSTSVSATSFSQTQASENTPKDSFSCSEEISNCTKVINHRYEAVDHRKQHSIQPENVKSPEKCEIADDRKMENISSDRYEVKDLELLDEINTKLKPWPKKFIERNNFTLGVIPGDFFESPKGYFVQLSNGTKYKILVGNGNGFSCDVDVYVDNILVICLRLNPGKSTIIEGPKYSTKAFVYLRARDAPASAKIQPKQESNGLIRALFLPEKLERTRAMSEPASYCGNMNTILDVLRIKKKSRTLRSHTSGHCSYERSFDFSQFCEGATALQGKQAPKNYEKVEEMEVNHEERVELLLRLISSTDDPNVPCSEEISSLYPPPIWNLS